jgi:hypothetical protein
LDGGAVILGDGENK